jgi:hypothetical protein
VEQVVRLIRSKGVGIYFVTQNPLDIPDAVAAQLGNRVQHALRAFTPKEQKAVRAAAESFRANPGVNVATEITELKVGEALVSLLLPDGSPSPVERTMIRPPRSRLGPVTAAERATFVSTSAVAGKSEERVDRESAEEILKARAEEAAAAAAEAKAAAAAAKAEDARFKEETRAQRRQKADRGFGEELAVQLGKSVQRQAVNRIAGSLVRGLLGGLFKGR